MNRVIKFRTAYEDMITGEISFMYWGRIDHLNNTVDSMVVFKSPGTSSHYEPIVDCQFTGLHDKNGVEIYEGDILKHKTWKVQPDGSMILSDKYIVYENRVVKYKTKHPFIGYAFHQDDEVIGNIFQNPELLEQ